MRGKARVVFGLVVPLVIGGCGEGEDETTSAATTAPSTRDRAVCDALRGAMGLAEAKAYDEARAAYADAIEAAARADDLELGDDAQRFASIMLGSATEAEDEEMFDRLVQQCEELGRPIIDTPEPTWPWQRD